MSTTIKSLGNSISSIKTSISAQNSKIDDLLKKIRELEAKNSKLEQRCNKLEGDYLDLPAALLEEFEDRTRRRKNIIISGVPEQMEGSADDRIQADKSGVEEILREIWEDYDDEMIRCHRIGRHATGRARLLRVVLNDEEAKKSILFNAAKELRKCPAYKNVYVNPDLTISQRKINKLLREELKRRKSEGEDVIIRRNKIVPRRENFH